MVIELTAAEAPRSTCHQGFGSRFVAVTEPSKKAPSVFPSTAEFATAVGYPGSVLLCDATLPCDRFVAGGAVPITCTSARLRLFVPVSCTRTYRPCTLAGMVLNGLGVVV